MESLFQTPASVVTGIGCFDTVGTHASALGSHCLIVTGERSMVEQGILDKAIHLMGHAGVKVTACTGVEHDPSLATVDRVRDVQSRNGCDVVLGLGGGSAIDVAKAAAGLAGCDQPTRHFFDGAPIPGSTLPILATPSTFGTGSEVTRVSVLTDPERSLKQSIRHDCMLPRVALIDPVIGAHAPPALTAACGMDALTQAIESYLSIHATDMTRAMSFSAIILLVAGLPRAYADGEDLSARESCANGSCMAGIALHNARLGLVHGLAHPLGALYHQPHGVLCGTLLPHILAFNREAAGHHYALLSGILGQDAAAYCTALNVSLQLPPDLSHLNIPLDDYPRLAELTLPSGSTKANPRTVTRADVLALLEQIC